VACLVAGVNGLATGSLTATQNSEMNPLGSSSEPSGVLFVLFIPSKDKDGNPLPRGQDQQLWADAAGDLLAEFFGGATIMPPAKRKWLNEETNTIITEDIVLVHSYARGGDASDEEKLTRLAHSCTVWGGGPGRVKLRRDRRRVPQDQEVYPRATRAT
jgi:hypothetical protein